MRETEALIGKAPRLGIHTRKVLLNGLKSCSGDFFLQNLIPAQVHVVLVLLLNPIGFFVSMPTIMVGLKCFVPQLYQFRRGMGSQKVDKKTYLQGCIKLSEFSRIHAKETKK